MGRYSRNRKAAVLLAAIVFKIGLGGCGSADTASPGNPGSGGTTPAPPPPPVPPPPPPPSSTLPAGVVSVSSSIQHVPDWSRTARTNFEGHDIRYPLKTGWGECVTLSALQSRSIEARCEVKTFRLLEFDTSRPAAAAIGTVVADAHLATLNANGAPIRCDLQKVSDSEYTLPDGATCNGAMYVRARCNAGQTACTVDWYSDLNDADGNNKGDMFPAQSTEVRDGILHINAAPNPDRVVHWWTQSPNNPEWRAPSRAGYYYFVEIEFKTIGSAALRVGLDRYSGGPSYYNDCTWAGTNESHNNCEDYISDWFQYAGTGYGRVRIPLF